MKVVSICCAILLSLYTFGQENKNFSFEIIDENFAKDWNIFGNGDHEVSVSTQYAKDGQNSILINQENSSNTFKAIGFTIPAIYTGKKIKLTGYVRTEDVESAGLWMRIDPGVAFDNMSKRPIEGTTDWNKYEITLDLEPDKAKKIVVGGLLSGAGKMWIDDLSVTIDGKSLDDSPLKKLSKAQQDTEFDNGSGIEFESLTPQQIKNATVLGKVWGFLKYHHPQIALGKYNWDYELFRIMESAIQASNAEMRDKLLAKWIDKYGEVKNCKNCNSTSERATLKPDHSWFVSENISEELQEKLSFIYQNRHQGKQFYVSTFPGVGNPDFTNENAYENMTYPDMGFRLLSLYRLWNIVHYFSPNRHITDTPWNEVLEKHISNFVNAATELEYELAAIQVIGEMNDSHSNLWAGGDRFDEFLGKMYPPVHVRFIEDKLTVTDIYNPELKDKIGLEIGDVITEIDGNKVDSIIKERLLLLPASNRPSQLRNLSGQILRSVKESIVLKIENDAGLKNVNLKLYPQNEINGYTWYRKPEGKSYKLLNDNIGYVTLANVTDKDPDEIEKQFEGTKGIIIDIRNYPSAFMPFTLGKYILPKNTPFARFTTVNLDHPGEFNMGKPVISGKSKTYVGKVIVLVNELSQSQAEYTAMAFRAAPNTIVIGSTTAGADGNVSSILLPGNMRTMISGIGVYYPDGTPTQRIGIVPDIEVRPTIKGIREGRDEVLEKAIELINKEK